MTAAVEKTPDQPSPALTHSEMIARLATDAECFRPEFFAVYGVFRQVGDYLPARPFLGWGIDLGEEGGALFWNPRDNTTHHSDSAEHVLLSHQRTGEAHLTWLE